MHADKDSTSLMNLSFTFFKNCSDDRSQFLFDYVFKTYFDMCVHPVVNVMLFIKGVDLVLHNFISCYRLLILSCTFYK